MFGANRSRTAELRAPSLTPLQVQPSSAVDPRAQRLVERFFEIRVPVRVKVLISEHGMVESISMGAE